MSAALPLYLDHVLIGVRDLGSAASVFASRLGFTLTPEGVHPGRGTHNRLAVFANEYLELIAVRDFAEGVFRPSLNTFLEASEGLYMFAAGTHDLDGTVSELRRRGVDVSDPTPGARSAGDGGPGYTWRSATIATDATPGSETFLIQHDVAIGERYTVPANPTGHANRATRVHRLVLAVHDADSASAAWAKLGLERAAPTPNGSDGRVRMALANSYLDLAAPTGPGPLADFLQEHGEAPYELVLEVADAAATVELLRTSGVTLTESTSEDGTAELRPEPAQACGVRLAFRQRTVGRATAVSGG